MEDRFDNEDRDSLASITNANRRVHSLSDHLHGFSGTGAGQKHRNHSLDARHFYNSRDHFNAADLYGYSIAGNSGRHDDSISLPRVGNSANGDGEFFPEFTASGGSGIFKAPIRSAVHPGRPPALELRPHPLRETQVGKCLRTVGCTETELWAGQDNGVRVWKFRDVYEAGSGLGGNVRRGDEDAAPFYESANTSPALCLVVDQGNRLVWTGHKDGKIRSWKDPSSGDGETQPFKEGLTWTAHKGPVLCLVMSSYGDLWSGSEGGQIKVWPWEAIEKSLPLSSEEKHMASFRVERAYVDLRTQVTVNGVCNISSSEVKAMLCDHARGRVWCATSLSFSLWDARSKELVKVFNIDGQIENRVEMPVLLDQAVEDEMKVKFVSSSTKREKPHQGFLHRSRNAIMGAADAVRRVATRGTGVFIEDYKKTEALVMTADGTIWSGCSNGLLVQWDGNGNRIQDFTHHPCAVLCFCTHGTRLWVGYASGVMQLLDLDGNIIKGWVAHSSQVIKMAIGGEYVFSLAVHGGIRGWHLTSPGPIDNIIRTSLAAKESSYTTRESLKILVGTWNVGQGKPVHEALESWLGSAVSDVGIVVVGLQEVEMGAGFLAMSAAKETVGLEGSAIGNLWQDAIGKVLAEGIVFERVGSRQLAGLLIAIWVRKNLRMHVGDLDVSAVACGLGRTIGNKGGVGLRLRVYDRIICFVNCHLAAHLEAVNRRNTDFNHIFRTMAFSRQSNFFAAVASSTSQVLRTSNGLIGNSHEGRSELSEADMVVFCGDFNYRLYGISYDEARDFVSQRSFDWLREKDQLRAEMKAGKVFQGMREAVIRFPPTYKFERHVPGLGGYDSGEKKRIPAWCDRVIYRDCRTGQVSECSLDCPILGSIEKYEACMDVTESDHKPVRCKFNVRLARFDRSVRRKEFGEIMNNNDQIKAALKELPCVPETTVSADRIILQNQETCSLRVTNKSQKEKAVFHILCEGQALVSNGEEPSDLRPRSSFGFPTWLEVTPAIGLIKPEDTMEVLIRHTEFQTLGNFVEGIPQNWWSEDTRDKKILLTVLIQGTSSLDSRIHQIWVRHCYSANKDRMESRTNSSRRGSNGSQRHSESYPRHGNYSDSVDHG